MHIFKDLVFTNHAWERMKERGIKPGVVWATWKRPDNSRYAESKGAWIYYRKFGGQIIEVVAKKNEASTARGDSGEGKEWIIISVWSRKAGTNRKNIKRNWLLQKLHKLIVPEDKGL